MQIKLIVNSACDLQNVNWHYGSQQPYAVVWVDSGKKCSTKIDVNNGVNPVWNEVFIIPPPSTSQPKTAIINIDIIHASTTAGRESLIIGSTKLPLRAALGEARSKGNASFSLNLERPSGQTQGSVQVQIEIKESFEQHNQDMSPQPQPQPQAQYQPQQMNQYPGTPAAVRPMYPMSSPQNPTPSLAQQPGIAMFSPTMMPQSALLGAACGTSILNAGHSQAQRAMMMYLQQMQQQRGAFQGPQGNNILAMMNNTGMSANGTNGTDITGAFGSGGFDLGGLGSGGLDLGRFGNGGFDMGMVGNGGFGFGGFDMSGFDFGGLGGLGGFGGFGFC